MVRASVPERFLVPRKDVRKHPRKSKSNATKTRDRLRKQKFIENKTMCCGFPFSGLDNPNFQKEMVTQVESQETKRDSKLHIAAETVKELLMQNKRLRSTIEVLQRTQAREVNTAESVDSEFRNSEHLRKLHADLEFEKERVTKLVTQNVGREREIRNLKEKLMNRETDCENLIYYRNSLTDRLFELDTRNQNLKCFIDSFTRKWKDKFQ